MRALNLTLLHPAAAQLNTMLVVVWWCSGMQVLMHEFAQEYAVVVLILLLSHCHYCKCDVPLLRIVHVYKAHNVGILKLDKLAAWQEERCSLLSAF
jgi:hypothetical protein